MPKFNLSGIEVDFPKEPYQCQLDYMEKVIIALKSGYNALLESPTGTGKTLCLLCSTLAWQQSYVKANSRKIEYGSGPIAETKKSVASSSSSSASSANVAAPKSIIIYASRTHSQLAQVVGELRSTPYKPNVTVLGSREQLCVNDKIKKKKGGALNFACNRETAMRSCSYKNNLDTYTGPTLSKSTGDTTVVLDIEDLTFLGRTDRICPYFYTREFSERSDLVLVPYNYLLDSSIRATLNLAWANAVVIFDEAHNLERVASDAASFKFTSIDIAMCIQELQNILKALSKTTEPKRDDLDSIVVDPYSRKIVSNTLDANMPTTRGVGNILRSLFLLEQRIDSLPLSKGMGSTPSIELTAEMFIRMLEEIGLRHVNRIEVIEELKRCSNYLQTEAQSISGSAAAVEPKISLLEKALPRVWRGRTLQECIAYSTDYKVFLCEDSVPTSGNQVQSSSNDGVVYLDTSNRRTRTRVINYWAFNSGIAMEELKQLGCRSIILTSGTLSPLAHMHEEMKIPFQVQLENPHVIDSNQVWVGAISHGLKGNQLNSSFAVRETDQYKDELGAAIEHICRAMAGRDIYGGRDLKGGVLIFFPSYGVMEKTILRWKQTGCFERLEHVGGSIVVEPKGSLSSTSGLSTGAQARAVQRAGGSGVSSEPRKASSIISFSAQFAKSSGGSSSNPVSVPSDEASALDTEWSNGDASGYSLMSLQEEFEQGLKKITGRCILMAVCRGKVSEGIDFRDSKGRVVIITGIPYAPHLDPQLILKKKFLDEKLVLNASKTVSKIQSNANCTATTTTAVNPYAASSLAAYANPLGKAPSAQAVTPLSAAAMSVYGSNSSSSSAKPFVPLPQPQSTSTAVVASNPVAGLSGQAWYNQTASRAVNQAVGRVIRHRNDWGAIFLLDDRFHSSKQQAELSKWVRPRITNYNSITTALQRFREFITDAMNDPRLSPPENDVALSTTNASTGPRILSRPHGFASSNGETSIDSGIQLQQVLVNESDLQSQIDGDGISYIDPQKLTVFKSHTSQGTSHSITAVDNFVTDAEHDEDELGLILSSQLSNSAASNNENGGQTQLSTALSINRGRSIVSMFHSTKPVATGTKPVATGHMVTPIPPYKPKTLMDLNFGKTAFGSFSQPTDSVSNREPETLDASKHIPSQQQLKSAHVEMKEVICLDDDEDMVDRLLGDETSFSKPPAFQSSAKLFASSSIGNSDSRQQRVFGIQSSSELIFSQILTEVKEPVIATKDVSRPTQMVDSGVLSIQSVGILHKLLGDIRSQLTSMAQKELLMHISGCKSAKWTKSQQAIELAQATAPILSVIRSQQKIREVVSRLGELVPKQFRSVFVENLLNVSLTLNTELYPASHAPLAQESAPVIGKKRALEDVDISVPETSARPLVPPGSIRQPRDAGGLILSQSEFAGDGLAASTSRLPPSTATSSLQRLHGPQTNNAFYSAPKTTTGAPIPAPVINFNSSKSSQSSQSNSTAAAGAAVRSENPTDSGNQTRTWKPSARASRNILESLTQSDLILSTKPSTKLATSGSSTSSKLRCLVCREVPVDPCLAPSCGHVCCRNCWKEWLFRSKTCPMCRVSTSFEVLQRIVVSK